MSDTELRIGGSAPAFKLKNQDETPVALKDLKGQWLVVYFYPRDDTPGCTKEACQFTELIQSFNDAGATVVGVSPDNAASHQKFIGKHKLKVELLSDPEHKMMEKYGAWGLKKMYGKETMGVKRSTVLIDPKGKIAHHWKSVRADGHAAKVLEKLQELQSA